jgi:ATP-dependent helicase Lhr and Lhr-like helicase
VFCHDIINARPYAFVDDAPLEERRTQAVQTRRAGSPSEMGALDAAAIDRVRDEVRPDPRDVDELHDALLTSGFLLESDLDRAWADELAARQRATRACVGQTTMWVAAERLPEMMAVHPSASTEPLIAAPASRTARMWTRAEALVELLRGRMAIVGPATVDDLTASIAVPATDVNEALLTLEAEGAILRGSFTPGSRGLEWCDRRLLARIHRYTLNRLRAEISPVSPAEYMRFLFAWQHVAQRSRLSGLDGLRAVIAQLDGLELPAAAWERSVLPARLEQFDPAWLDMLCLTGEVGWARVSCGPTQMVGATPIGLYLRAHGDAWVTLRVQDAFRPGGSREQDPPYGARAGKALECLQARGASFAHEIRTACDLDADECYAALGELVAAGLVTSDSFAGLRAIVTPGARRQSADRAGRWSLLPACPERSRGAEMMASRDEAVKALAWTLLARYGVVFRRVIARETIGVPWREIVRVYRTLEARGDIRGGRFVSGMSGEQFALADAVDRLREVRRSTPDTALITIAAADPLNLTGIVTQGDRVRTAAGNRIVYRNGVPLAALEGDMLRTLGDIDPSIAAEVAAAAAGRKVPVVSGYVGRLG